MSDKAERRAAREIVGKYHEAELAKLVARISEAVDRHRAGELDPFEVDEVVFQYSRAAKELWKFCNLGPVESVASTIRDYPSQDWWERGARRQRRQPGTPDLEWVPKARLQRAVIPWPDARVRNGIGTASTARRSGSPDDLSDLDELGEVVEPFGLFNYATRLLGGAVPVDRVTVGAPEAGVSAGGAR